MQNNSASCTQNYAGFWVRFFAYLLDMTIVLIGMGLVKILLSVFMTILEGTALSDVSLFHYDLKDMLLYLVKVGYFTLLTASSGTTIGKKLLNLQVIRAGSEGDKPSFFDVLYRESIGRFLSSFFLYIGYIMAGIDREKRGLHDILCRTRVVYAERRPDKRVFRPNVKPDEPKEEIPWTGVRPDRWEMVDVKPEANGLSPGFLQNQGMEQRVNNIPEDITGGYSLNIRNEREDTGSND